MLIFLFHFGGLFLTFEILSCKYETDSNAKTVNEQYINFVAFNRWVKKEKTDTSNRRGNITFHIIITIGNISNSNVHDCFPFLFFVPGIYSFDFR